MVNLQFWAITLDVVGKLMVAYTALLVHMRVRKEHKIDKKVFMAMRREHTIGLLGIGLIIIAYLLELKVLL
jgi:hypothetical protein